MRLANNKRSSKILKKEDNKLFKKGTPTTTITTGSSYEDTESIDHTNSFKSLRRGSQPLMLVGHLKSSLVLTGP
jgi:hypothetical protein